ncbi:FAD-dependent oxidoreductase [Helicobacter apodemus]|uniref:FAD-dependent oxidoreductase n=1 Tax=Helicobacter apodemus TaxID=135569 RepID=UPI001EF3ABF0|nr:FAD-dependent oxidoreductase [Helicobacter apodemus]
MSKILIMYGGTCINIGCLPSKSLVKNALLSPKDANFVEKQTFYAKAVQEEQNLTTTLRQKNYDKLNNLSNVTIFNAKGEFHSDTIVKLTMQGENEEIFIESEQIFINTGAKDIIPNIKGITQSKHIFTSKTLMNSPFCLSIYLSSVEALSP